MPDVTQNPLEPHPDGQVELLSETLILPTGCPVDDSNARHFAVFIRWMGVPAANGTGGWAVTSGFVEEQLSRAGKWNDMVPKFKRHQYRFDTREKALAAARVGVDTRVVNGRTYAQFRAWRAERDRQAGAAQTPA